MKPFLVYGGSDKARFDFGKETAAENLWNFISLEAKNFEAFSKPFISQSLDSSKTLFFLYNAQSLSIKHSIKFLELIKNSNNIFILATPSLSSINYILRKSCLHKSLGLKLNKIDSWLKAIMTIGDRDSVRLILKDADPIFLFHILKKSAWKKPEVLEPMMKINRNLYKVKPAYIKSLLAFAFPPKKYDTHSAKKEDNKMMKKILAKIRKSFHVSKSKAADLYLLFNRLGSVPEKAIVLSDEEKEFLGISSEKVEQQTLEAPVKTSSLSEFF